jgi:hypothetical protein
LSVNELRGLSGWGCGPLDDYGDPFAFGVLDLVGDQARGDLIKLCRVVSCPFRERLVPADVCIGEQHCFTEGARKLVWRPLHSPANLGAQDTRDYVEEIHKRIIRYFNANVLGENLLSEGVVSPQRHPFGNIEAWTGFVRSEAGKSLDLKHVLRAFDADFDNPEGYEIVPPAEEPDPY